jgi:hypothetical protein
MASRTTEPGQNPVELRFGFAAPPSTVKSRGIQSLCDEEDDLSGHDFSHAEKATKFVRL